jgi:hypothetical protein
MKLPSVMSIRSDNLSSDAIRVQTTNAIRPNACTRQSASLS